MKTFTTVAVIAALALATQAFAMGGGSKGGQSMPSAMSTTTMKTGSMAPSGASTMIAAAPMSGPGTMATTMTASGMTKTPIKPGTTK